MRVQIQSILMIFVFLLPCGMTTTVAHSQTEAGAAREAFIALMKKYRTTDAVEMTSSLVISIEGGEAAASGDPVKATFKRLKNGTGLIKVRGYTVYLHDEQGFVTHESNADAYFEFNPGAYVHSAVVWECFGSFDRIPFPHLALLWGSSEVDESLMELYADTPELAPTKLVDRVVDGKPVRTLTLKSDNATMQLDIDPKSGWVTHITHTISGGMLVPEGQTRINQYTVDWTSHDQEIDQAELTFDPGSRERIMDVRSLDKSTEMLAIQRPEAPPAPAAGPLIGKDAPGFILQSMDGELVALEKLEGQVVVLDFWAVWCPPCREALPRLHSVAKWASDESLPVRVFAVNTFENGSTIEEKIEIARKFWNQFEYTLPVLMDSKNSVAEKYGVTGIPTTFIIGPDGVVRAQHIGFAPGYESKLKRDIRNALEM